MPSDRALLVAAGGGIGDTLLAGVVAHALHSRYAQVDALVLPAHRASPKHDPAIDRVHVLASPVPTAEDLRAVSYAAAVVTWATLTTALVPALARIPVRVGQARRLYSPLFTERVTVRSERGDHTTHWTQILLDYARAIGCDDPVARPAFAVDGRRSRTRPMPCSRNAASVRNSRCSIPRAGSPRSASAGRPAGFIALARALRERGCDPAAGDRQRRRRRTAEAVRARCGARSRSPARRRSGRSRRWPSARSTSSRSTRGRCTSPPPPARRPSGSSPCNPTSRTAGRRSARARRSSARSTRARPAHRKETCPDFACVRHLDIAAIVAALDGLLATVIEREPI